MTVETSPVTAIADHLVSSTFTEQANGAERSMRIALYAGKLLVLMYGQQMSGSTRAALVTLTDGMALGRKMISAIKVGKDGVLLHRDQMFNADETGTKMHWFNAKKAFLIPNHVAALPSILVMCGVDLGQFGKLAAQTGKWCWFAAMFCEFNNQVGRGLSGREVADEPYGMGGATSEFVFSIDEVLLSDTMPEGLRFSINMGTGAYWWCAKIWNREDKATDGKHTKSATAAV